MSEAVTYRVSVRRPHSHLFDVEARFPGGAVPLVVQLPVWTPGSYLVREFARQLQDIEASTEGGRILNVKRLDKHRFEIASGGVPVTLRYRVYANELSVRTSHLDASHAYINGATLFLYSETFRESPHHVRIDGPTGWTPFCALEPQGEEHVAPNYDALIDSPFEIGSHQPLDFTAADVPHRVVMWGDPKPDRAKLAADLTRVCETQAAMFGGLPFKRYLFLLYLTDKGRGGLEHANSTALMFPRFGMTSAKGWEDFLTLAAHEYFHAWNVKRILPKAFVPYQYDREVYTSLLWAFEGITSYYDNLLVRRAGLMSAPRFLTRLGESLSALWCSPGRKVQSLEESSLTTWIKYYRQDENFLNSGISYYLKGELVAALLDLELRKRTQGERSLDDLMRLLWKTYGDGRGVPENGIEAAAAELAGADLNGFFEANLRGTSDLDLSAFGYAGLEARFRMRESAADKGGSPPRVKAGEARPKGWLGATFRGDRTVATVVEGSPAYEAGLYAEDELVALDGFKIDGSTLSSRCEERRPGDPIRVTVFRRDQLVDVPLILGQRPADAVYLARVEGATAPQQAAYTKWLGQPWDENPTAS